MKKKPTSKSAFLNLRVLIGVFIASVGALLAVLVIGASSNALRADAQGASGTAHLRRIADDRDPELVKKRQQFLESFFGRGPGGVSPSEYAAGLAAARALPPSPVLQGRTFTPTTGWTFPVLPPITNSYGGDATAQIHSIAIDPTNANVVYTGSSGGLAKTTDGGSTWHYLSDAWTSQSVTSIAVDYNTLLGSKFIYVGTGNEGAGPYGVGIYRSSDDGASWDGPLGVSQFSGTAILAIATTDSQSRSDAVYVVNKRVRNAPSTTAGLWRSTDSGSSWTLLRERDGDINGYTGVFDVAISRSYIFITEDDGVFKRSVDDSGQWVLIHDVPNVPGAQDRLGYLSLYSTLYLMQPGDPNHNFYKSTDDGSSWIQIATHCPPGANNCAGTEIGFAVFAVNARPKVILAGNSDFQHNASLWRTSDEGASWTDVGGGIHPDQHAIAFAPNSLVYEGNDGGIVKSTDAGQNWINLNHNFPGALLYSAALSSDGRMIAGTQDSGVVFSNLGPWDMIVGGDSGYDLIDRNDSTNAYWVIYDVLNYGYNRFNRTTYQSTDITPNQIRNENFFFFPAFSMNPLSPAHVIAAGQHVARTLDAPHVTQEGWTTIGGNIATVGAVRTAVEAPNNANFIYAIITDGYFQYGALPKLTTDANNGGSATWKSLAVAGWGDAKNITVDPTNPQIAYLAGDHGIYKTTNAGGSWTRIGIPDLVYYDVAIEPGAPNYLYAACNAGVFSSTDGGVTWANMSAGIPSGMAVTSLCLNRGNHAFNLIASTYGRGVYGILLPAPRP